MYDAIGISFSFVVFFFFNFNVCLYLHCLLKQAVPNVHFILGSWSLSFQRDLWIFEKIRGQKTRNQFFPVPLYLSDAVAKILGCTLRASWLTRRRACIPRCSASRPNRVEPQRSLHDFALKNARRVPSREALRRLLYTRIHRTST